MLFYLTICFISSRFLYSLTPQYFAMPYDFLSPLIGAVVHAQFSPPCKWLYLPYLLSFPWSSNWVVKTTGTQNGYNSPNSHHQRNCGSPRRTRLLIHICSLHPTVFKHLFTFFQFPARSITSKTTGRFTELIGSEHLAGTGSTGRSWWWRQSIFHACDSETMLAIWSVDDDGSGALKSISLWMAVDLLEYQQWWDNKIVLLQWSSRSGGTGSTAKQNQSMDTDWYNLMLDLHTEVLHGMNRAQGLHWQSQLMVIPIPQYKDFATISSLKELNLVTAGSYNPKVLRVWSWPGCQKIGNDQFKIVWVMRQLTWYRLCATIPTWRVSTYQLSWLRGLMLGALLWINWLGKLVLNGSRHLKITLSASTRQHLKRRATPSSHQSLVPTFLLLTQLPWNAGDSWQACIVTI
jgi:hypothetical protein